jgi:type VI secretion system protein ImpJ
MLLTPQHFQQNDIHWSATLQHRLRGMNAHHWGVLDLELDMPLLAGRTIDVKLLSCIFPDGTPFVLKPGNGKSLRLVLKPDDVGEGKLRICVAMPPRTGAMNVQSTSIKRYESVLGANPVIDEMTGFADVFVDRIRPTVELYRELEVPAGYLSIALVEVSHNIQSGQLEPTAYHPPMLRLGASGFLARSTGLLSALQKLRDRMWERMHKLTGMSPTDTPERVAAMSAEERSQLGVARNIASALPMFDAIMLDPEVAPVEAYRTLAGVVGNIAAVGSNPTPLVMPPYAHENCAPQFMAAIEFVSRKLALINTDWDSLAFTRVDEMTFTRRLPADVRKSVLIEVRLREGQSLSDIQSWLEDSRVGTEDVMRPLRERRIKTRWSILSAADTAARGLRSDAIVVRLENQQVDLPQLGLVDCFQPGRQLLIQSNSAQLMPSHVILQHHRSGDADDSAGRGSGAPAYSAAGATAGNSAHDPRGDVAEGVEAIHA